MIKIGKDEVSAVFLKNMGIKTISVGNEEVYSRPGGYFYIQLVTNETASTQGKETMNNG